MKLELKHIAKYLPYGVNILYDRKITITGINQNENGLFIHGFHGENKQNIHLCVNGEFETKLILSPISDLSFQKVIDHLHGKMCDAYFDYIDIVDENTSIKERILQAPYEIIEYCFENHIDVFGLIDQGLAIDINTIES